MIATFLKTDFRLLMSFEADFKAAVQCKVKSFFFDIVFIQIELIPHIGWRNWDGEV